MEYCGLIALPPNDPESLKNKWEKYTSYFLPPLTSTHLVSRHFYPFLCLDLADVYGNRISQLSLWDQLSVFYNLSSCSKKTKINLKSSLLNLAETCVGKSLNKNKFVDVLRQETRRTDKMFHEPTLPSASAFTIFSANSPCSTLQMKPTHQPVMTRSNAFTKDRKSTKTFTERIPKCRNLRLWWIKKTPDWQQEWRKVLVTNNTLRWLLYFQSLSTN